VLTFEVTAADTAVAFGSGDVAVLATPRLLAWCEMATTTVLGVPDGRTSVGSRVSLEHLLASPVGVRVTVDARITQRDGRLVRFSVTVHDHPDGGPRLIATAEVTRVVVDRERFLARLPELPGDHGQDHR
jgi:fluoroacetyl-CoA thioesterase